MTSAATPAPAPDPARPDPAKRTAPRASDSILKLRLRRFRRLKRGYYSFLALVLAYALSFLLPFLMSNRAILVSYRGTWSFPAFRAYLHDTFGLTRELVYSEARFSDDPAASNTGEVNYRELQARFRASGEGDFVILPPYPYSPYEQFLEREGGIRPPHAPDAEHWFGTDDRGRDVLVRLAYGFRISVSFALLVAAAAYTLGTLVGATLGYFAGRVDLVGLRIVEIFGVLPFLYTVMIVASIVRPSFIWLAVILTVFGWMAIAYYVRGEFLREKAKDYVAAAHAIGESNLSIIVRHILPNALTPIIAFAPFAIVGEIVALVSLDYLGFGLPAPTPSWGELIGQGRGNYQNWHLIVFPLGAMFVTLQLIVFIGEAVREAFDPKVFSRLR